MENPSTLNRALSRLGDILLAGLFACIGSIGIITLGASWAASITVLRPHTTGEPFAGRSGILGEWWQDFRIALHRTKTLSLLVVAAIVVGLSDILFVLNASSGVLRYPILSVGLILLAFAAVIGPRAFARCIDVPEPLGRLLVNAVGLAAATPLASLGASAATVVAVGTSVVAPPFAPAAIGLAALVTARAHEHSILKTQHRQKQFARYTPAYSDNTPPRTSLTKET